MALFQDVRRIFGAKTWDIFSHDESLIIGYQYSRIFSPEYRRRLYIRAHESGITQLIRRRDVRLISHAGSGGFSIHHPRATKQHRQIRQIQLMISSPLKKVYTVYLGTWE
jgi:hypothetical protein